MGKKKIDPKKQQEKTPADDITGTYYYGVGRRKSSVATVRLYPKGSGKIYVNGKEIQEVFPLATHQMSIKAPLTLTSLDDTCDATIHVKGGGVSGQAGAIRLGITRALIKWQEDLRPVVKAQGYLTRDSRVKERKKPGLKRARRAPQWAKR